MPGPVRLPYRSIGCALVLLLCGSASASPILFDFDDFPLLDPGGASGVQAMQPSEAIATTDYGCNDLEHCTNGTVFRARWLSGIQKLTNRREGLEISIQRALWTPNGAEPYRPSFLLTPRTTATGPEPTYLRRGWGACEICDDVPFEVTFSRDVLSVQVDLSGRQLFDADGNLETDPTGYVLYLEAYDAAGALLGTVQFERTDAVLDDATLQFTAPEGSAIRWVRFGGGSPDRAFSTRGSGLTYADNILVTVPEPSTALLLSLGLLGLAAHRKR